MDHLFLPRTRLHDLIEWSQGHRETFRGDDHPELLQELYLDASVEELLSAERAFTYADLYAMLEIGQHKVAWLTPEAAIVCEGWIAGAFLFDVEDGGAYHIRFTADSKNIFALAGSFEELSEIVDVILRLLAVSVVHSLLIERCSSHGLFRNAPPLAYMMEQGQSLKVLSLKE
jgi:hypothetical protein